MTRPFLRSARLRTLVAAIVVAATPGWAQAQSLADALAAAYDHSGLIEQNRATLRAADEDVAQAVARLRPAVEYAVQAGYRNTQFGDDVSATYELSAALTLFDFGKNRLAVAQTKEAVLATRAALEGIEQQVLSRAVAAYFNVRRASEFVSLRQNNVRLITQELRAARDRFEVGEVTRTDVALAEARLAGARSNLAAAEGDLARAVAEYRAAVGSAPGRLQAPGALPRIPTPHEARRIALAEHPSLRQIQRQIAAAEIGIERAVAGATPTGTLGGSVQFDDHLNRTDSLSLRIAGPIYQGGLINAQVRQATAQRDGARAGLHVQKHAIEQGVENAYAALAVARAGREASDRQIRAARVAFRGVREEAALGARTTLDVLDAEQELLDARANAISAEVDENIAAYQILFAIGRLTTQHLGLAVESYDPAAYYNLVKDAPISPSVRGAALDRVLKTLGKE
ncbi:MAG: TolC family outer membrane protein [Shimia sp.]